MTNLEVLQCVQKNEQELQDARKKASISTSKPKHSAVDSRSAAFVQNKVGVFILALETL